MFAKNGRLALNLTFKNALAVMFLVFIVSAPSITHAQAQKDQFIIDSGISFTQATVTQAQNGLVGLDLQAYKMLTNNISLGFEAGYDVVSFKKLDNYYSRLGVMPFIIKSKYFVNPGGRFQIHATVGGGLYITNPHLDIVPVGDISSAKTLYGGSVGVGFNYWYLLIQGIGGEFEYHFFPTQDGSTFSYFALRLNFSLIKF